MEIMLPRGFWNNISFFMNNFLDFLSKYVLTQKRSFLSTFKRLFLSYFVQLLVFAGFTLLALAIIWVSKSVQDSILFYILVLAAFAIFSVLQALNFLFILKFFREANNFIEKQEEKPLSHLFREIYSEKTLTLKAIKLSLLTHFISFLAFALSFLYFYFRIVNILEIDVEDAYLSWLTEKISIDLLVIALFSFLIPTLLFFCFILSLSFLLSNEKFNEFKLYKEVLRNLLSVEGVKFLFASLLYFLIVNFIAYTLLILLFISFLIFSFLFGLIVGSLQLTFNGFYETYFSIVGVVFLVISLFLLYLFYLAYLYPFSLLGAKKNKEKIKA